MNTLLLAGALVFAQSAPSEDAPATRDQPSEAPAAEALTVETPAVEAPAVEALTIEALTIEALSARVLELERSLASQGARVTELEAALPVAAASPWPPRPPGMVSGPVRVEASARVPEAVAFGAPIFVEGHVAGDAISFGDDVTVRSGAVVAGDAISFGGDVHVLPGGRVDGDQISYLAAAPASVSQAPARDTGWLRGLARRLVTVLAFAGAGVMVVGLFPTQVEGVTRTLSEHPLRSGLLGVGLTLLTAMLALVLTVTIIGAPFAAALVVGAGAAAMLGFVASCQALGDRLPIADVGARRWLAFLVGVLAVGAVGSLPLVGQLALGLVGFAGLGAALHSRFGTLPQV